MAFVAVYNRSPTSLSHFMERRNKIHDRPSILLSLSPGTRALLCLRIRSPGRILVKGRKCPEPQCVFLIDWWLCSFTSLAT
jgi:hypothetical protein